MPSDNTSDLFYASIHFVCSLARQLFILVIIVDGLDRNEGNYGKGVICVIVRW